MKDFTVQLIDKIIDDWEENKAPFRLVMISSVRCYVCNKYDNEPNNIYCRYTDDFDGLYNKKGWSFCSNCKYKVDLAEKYYSINQNYLTYNDSQFLRDIKFSFLRVSSNKNLKPYIQKYAKIRRSSGNSLVLLNGRLFVPISWTEGFNELQKLIYLSNIIYFNNSYFGKKFNFGPINKISSKWLSYITKEYDYSNSWRILLTVLDRKNIPNGLIREICFYWGGFN